MSDRDRSGFSHDDANRGPLDRAADALDGRDDTNRGPLDRASNALDGRDDPNRGPVDRGGNALSGHDDPNRGPLDRAANAVTGHSGGVSAALGDASAAVHGHDDPARGPVDRAENTLSGYDDPNRGPLDRAANAVTGHSGGVAAALGGSSSGLSAHDDPNRGPLDRAANAVTGHSGGTSALGVAAAATSGSGETTTVSAIFDSQSEAQSAVAELRQQGVSDGALSVIAQSKGTMTTRDVEGEVTDEEHTNILRGILGGGAAGAGLGVLALAIPGVGPLAALGAIAATAVPEAMAIGALAGAAAGTFNETLLKHGIGDDDAAYYGDRLKGGGVVVTAHANGGEAERIRDTLHRHGGHSASNARVAAV